MPPLRTLLVDDEPLARERLRALLRLEEAVEIIGECTNGIDAVAVIRSVRPDLVFLDVQMPGCNGLQVVHEIPPEARPAVVFVTAHQEFAVEAFAVQAVDYLLKPFDRERLSLAVQRGRAALQTRNQPLPPGKLFRETAPERLTFKADGRLVFLRPDEIIWAEAADNYVILHLEAAKPLMVRETLTTLETRLGKHHFARVNRSALVHLDRVKEFEPTFHGDYIVVLRDGTRLPLSRALRGQLDRFAGPGDT